MTPLGGRPVLLLLAGVLAACGPRDGALQEAQRQQLRDYPALEFDETAAGEADLELPLGPEDSLLVEHAYGEIVVRAGGDRPPRATAAIEVTARREGTARRVLADSRLEAERTPAGLVLRLVQPERASVPGGEEGLRFVSSARLVIDVPPRTRLSIESQRGDVSVTGPCGATRVMSRRGDVRLRNVRGGAIVECTTGNVKLRQLSGGPVRAETGQGLVALVGAEVDAIRLASRKGRIAARNARAAALEIRAAEGGIELAEIEGEIDAETGAGALVLTAASGRRVRARSELGSVVVRDVRALALEAFAARGVLTAERIAADTLDLATGTGAIVLTDVAGELTARTGAGAIDAERLRGGRLLLEAGREGVSVRGASGNLEAVARRDRIRIEGLEGGLVARADLGSISAAGVFRDLDASSGTGRVVVEAREGSRVIEPWSLRADQGDVVLTLPPSFSCDIEATAGEGAFASELPVRFAAESSAAGRALRGTIGEGGGKIVLTTERGSIAVRRGRAAAER
ncbi:MAG: DUF4097 family beta strand repeat-containing protein [Planctomycetota bacterium]